MSMFKIEHNIPQPARATNASPWRREIQSTFNALQEGDSFEAVMPKGFGSTKAKWAAQVRNIMSDWNRKAYSAAGKGEPPLILSSRTQPNGLVRIWKIRNPKYSRQEKD